MQAQKISELPEVTTPGNSDLFVTVKNGTTSKITYGNLGIGGYFDRNPGSTLIYPKIATDRVVIGAAFTSFSQQFQVFGTSRFSGDASLLGRIYLGSTSSIYEDGSGNLTFIDNNAGTYTLNDIVSIVGSSYNSGSGTTIDGSNNINLGGDLTGTTNINTGTYTFTVRDGASPSDYFSLSSSGVSLQTNNVLTLRGTQFSLGNSSNISFGYSSVSNKLYISDVRANPYGLEYNSDYSTYIKQNRRSLTDVGTVLDLITDIDR